MRKPAWFGSVVGGRIGRIGRMQAYVEFISLDVLEIDGDGALAWLDIVDIACSMRCQISMTILESWDLELPAPALAVS